MHPTDVKYLQALEEALGDTLVYTRRESEAHFGAHRYIPRRGGPGAVNVACWHHSGGGRGNGQDGRWLWTYAIEQATWTDENGVEHVGWSTGNYSTIIRRDGLVEVIALPSDFTWHATPIAGAAYAICLPGNYHHYDYDRGGGELVRNQPTGRQLANAELVMRVAAETMGWENVLHREKQRTVCPGDDLAPELEAIRDRLHAEDDELDRRIRDWAAAASTINTDTGLALYRRIRADGFFPLADEDGQAFREEAVVPQLAIDLSSTERRAYRFWAETGEIDYLVIEPA